MDKQVLIALIGVFGGILTMIAKSIIDRRATRNDISKRDKNISDRLGSIENQFTQFDVKMDKLINDHDFRSNFKNALRVKINSLLKAGMIEAVHRNILTQVATWVEDYGLRYYYTSYRKSENHFKKDLDQFLYAEFNVKKDMFHEIINDKFPYPKLNGNKKIYFLDLLQKTKINAASETLIFTLVRNGLTEDAFINHFEDYIDTFYTCYVESIQLWHLLKEINENDI